MHVVQKSLAGTDSRVTQMVKVMLVSRGQLLLLRSTVLLLLPPLPPNTRQVSRTLLIGWRGHL